MTHQGGLYHRGLQSEQGLIRILMCWDGEEKEITFVEETTDSR